MKKIVAKWWDSNILHDWQVGEYKAELALCETMGYIVEETGEKLVLAQTISAFGAHMGVIIIAKGCIKSIKELRVK